MCFNVRLSVTDRQDPGFNLPEHRGAHSLCRVKSGRRHRERERGVLKCICGSVWGRWRAAKIIRMGEEEHRGGDGGSAVVQSD